MATYYGRKYRILENRHRLKEIYLSIRIALRSKHLRKPVSEKPVYVMMVDGRGYHGGLTDRFKGIISLYAYCKHRGLPFRINYTYPFPLERYLSPAKYDWTLKEGEYTDNPLYSRILFMRGEHLATRLLNLKSDKQIHFYGNRNCLGAITKFDGEDYDWGDLFRELFKPGKALAERIESTKREIGGDYFAAVFRFQNLLGDFKEYQYKSIPDTAQREELIEKCLAKLVELKKEHGDMPLLVTSDSKTFLARASQLQGVYTIPGDLVHIDNVSDAKKCVNNDPYLKSLLDFFMLSEARKIYRISTGKMYRSDFPVFAAKINRTPFEALEI